MIQFGGAKPPVATGLVDNLSWNIVTLSFIFNSFESWKDLSPERLETIKPRNTASRGCIN